MVFDIFLSYWGEQVQNIFFDVLGGDNLKGIYPYAI